MWCINSLGLLLYKRRFDGSTYCFALHWQDLIIWSNQNSHIKWYRELKIKLSNCLKYTSLQFYGAWSVKLSCCSDVCACFVSWAVLFMYPDSGYIFASIYSLLIWSESSQSLLHLCVSFLTNKSFLTMTPQILILEDCFTQDCDFVDLCILFYDWCVSFDLNSHRYSNYHCPSYSHCCWELLDSSFVFWNVFHRSFLI